MLLTSYFITVVCEMTIFLSFCYYFEALAENLNLIFDEIDEILEQDSFKPSSIDGFLVDSFKFERVIIE